MHASSTRDAATLRPAGSPAGRPNWSRATRRDVRRAAALANELNFFSFTVHPDGAITWILRHQGISMAKPKPEGKGEPAALEEPSARTRRSRARAAAHAAQMQLAREFRARHISVRRETVFGPPDYYDYGSDDNCQFTNEWDSD